MALNLSPHIWLFLFVAGLNAAIKLDKTDGKFVDVIHSDSASVFESLKGKIGGEYCLCLLEFVTYIKLNYKTAIAFDNSTYYDILA